MSGQLITIEGISGVGKTYYFNKLKKYVIKIELYLIPKSMIQSNKDIIEKYLKF